MSGKFFGVRENQTFLSLSKFYGRGVGGTIRMPGAPAEFDQGEKDLRKN